MSGAAEQNLQTLLGHGIHTEGAHAGLRSHNRSRGMPDCQNKAERAGSGAERYYLTARLLIRSYFAGRNV